MTHATRVSNGRFVLYFFSPAHGAVIGCNLSIIEKRADGIHFTFDDDTKPNSSYNGVLYQIREYAYFIAWPAGEASELVFGIIQFDHEIGKEGASGHILGIQRQDKKRRKSGTHMFPSRIKLLPLVEFKDKNALNHYALSQTGEIPIGIIPPVIIDFFEDELSPS